MKVTIKDIARMAGVSRATVSKIINNYDDVSEVTRQKVLKIMEETGYRPTFSARSLSSQRSNLIAVVYAGKVNANFNHPFFVDVVNSFKKNIGFLGYDLLFFSNEKFQHSDENYLTRCKYFQVDGCLIISGEDIEPTIEELDQSHIPCIGVDIPLKGNRSGYLMTDNYKVSAKVVEHFYLLGYRHIALISGKPDSAIANLRKEGFIQAMQQYGLTIHENWLLHGDFYEESGYCAMKELLKQKPYPQAVFAASDLMAFGAIRAIKEAGLRVPHDIAIVGCDDIVACRYSDPQLTTIRQDKEKIGKLAAYMLVDLIHDQIKSTSVMVEPELIVRGTCGSRIK
ncbi:LacI family DNA-binding transcriptional regulator [Lihuaxuella thermophila]|uniref:LacI family transcriptional regulator n=1 Tax=Lihuaxuella thermophila TaxID=1173111 RepID=A0A1H8FE75_9BACL|nr:LacI family DNA-binding transcriptional regulator [Lihuaxuella thermophila]SEN30029.1 LacI family transcriptional regulator [Lihuaxuella thermophila]